MNQAAIGARIRAARQRKKMTQEHLAEAVDIGFYYIGEIERGEKLPSLTVFVKIAEVLGVSADSLLKDELTATPEFNKLGLTVEEFARKLDQALAEHLDEFIDIMTEAFRKRHDKNYREE